MTIILFFLTLRQLLSRRILLALVGLAAIPVVMAVIYQLSDTETIPTRWTSRVLYVGLTVTAVLPLTALVLGASVMGDEIEDGTITYLLTKPVPRWQILGGKLAASWVASMAIVLPSTVVSGAIALGGLSSSVIWGFAVAVVLGSLAYCAVFTLLSVTLSRALITGLVYVFLWEGAITTIFRGTRYLSVRHFSLGIAGWIAGTGDSTFDAYIRGETALILLSITILGAVTLAIRNLSRLEVRDHV